MPHTDKYSIAICPPDGQNAAVAVTQMKAALKAKIGWYPSVNSKAHITLNVFHANEDELEKWRAMVKWFCLSRHAFLIRLTGLSQFRGSNAFYLSLDEGSHKAAVRMMREFHKSIKLDTEDKSSLPHMSIGRQLSEEQLITARQLWENHVIDIHFICDGLCLRKLNTETRQYEIIEKFMFEGRQDQLQMAF